MASSVSAKVETLSAQTRGFVGVASGVIPLLQGRTLSLPQIKDAHERVFKVYQSHMAQIDALKAELQRQLTEANQAQMLPLIQRVTSLETDLSEQLNRFNDTVLTFHPTVKIFYGRPCIGPRIPPQIDTHDSRILAMFAQASCMREIRGDGNCFLSAFATRLMENLVEKKQLDRFISFVLEEAALPQELKEDVIATLISLEEGVEETLQDNDKILSFISFLRHLTAAEMKANPDDFEPFFLADIEQVFEGSTQGKPYTNLVDQYVLKMGMDFSHPMITALCRKLEFPIRIIDPRIGAAEGLNTLDRADAHATFCRNGSHYFVLYTLQESPRIPPPTQITVKCDVGFGNQLFIRGDGPGMTWDKGIPLKNVGSDIWVFETELDFENFQYKILLNDQKWEEGTNHTAQPGKKIELTSVFSNL